MKGNRFREIAGLAEGALAEVTAVVVAGLQQSGKSTLL